MPIRRTCRDSGVKVVVAEAPGYAALGPRRGRRLRGADRRRGRRVADVIMMVVPDQTQKVVYETAVRDNLKDGDMLMFAHGFNIHFNQIVPPANVDVTMVAPKGPGHLVRRVYTEGGGVPALVAVYQDATGKAREQALAYAKGIGCAPRGRHRDHLQGRDRDRPVRRAGRALRRRERAGPRRLRDPGRRRLPAGDRLLRVPARAEADRGPHLRARHQRHALLDLRHRRVRRHDPRQAHHQRRRRARRWSCILEEIQTGEFAREWILENMAGRPVYNAIKREEAEHEIEIVGRQLRAMMPWLGKGGKLE